MFSVLWFSSAKRPPLLGHFPLLFLGLRPCARARLVASTQWQWVARKCRTSNDGSLPPNSRNNFVKS